MYSPRALRHELHTSAYSACQRGVLSKSVDKQKEHLCPPTIRALVIPRKEDGKADNRTNLGHRGGGEGTGEGEGRAIGLHRFGAFKDGASKFKRRRLNLIHIFSMAKHEDSQRPRRCGGRERLCCGPCVIIQNRGVSCLQTLQLQAERRHGRQIIVTGLCLQYCEDSYN